MTSYILKETSSGRHTLVYRNSREVRLHSAYDPELEAERAAAEFNPGRATMIAVSGIGLGYQVQCLRKKFPEMPLIAIERDAEVVAIARKTCPSHLEDVAVVTSTADLPSVFEAVDISSFRGIAHFVHRPSYQLYPDFYDSIMRDMGQYISSKISDLLTRFEFEMKWVDNILANLPRLYDAGRVGDLFGRFRGCPGVIVSAGPSLRKNAHLLNQMRDRALVVCVDTALKVLRKMDITPHIVMTLDAQKYSIKHFLGAGAGAALLADLVSCPGVLRAYQGKRIVSTTSKYHNAPSGELKRETTPFMDWVEKHVAPIGDIQSGGSVATSVFDLMITLGCSPIILVGQDLAYTGREIHCSGTYHNDEWLPRTSRLVNLDTINQQVIRRRKIKYVTAYGGEGKVISDFVFDLYRGWFEDSTGKVQVPVINATGGGARIDHTREASLASIVETSSLLDPSPGEILDRALASGKREKPGRLAAALRGVLAELAVIKKMAADGLADGGGSAELEEMINSGDIRLILLPYLRKSRTFLSRYSAAAGEGERLILTDLAAAADRILPALERSISELDKM